MRDLIHGHRLKAETRVHPANLLARRRELLVHSLGNPTHGSLRFGVTSLPNLRCVGTPGVSGRTRARAEIEQANAPAGTAGAVRRSLGSAALVAVVEARREPVADDPGGGVGHELVTYELVCLDPELQPGLGVQFAWCVLAVPPRGVCSAPPTIPAFSSLGVLTFARRVDQLTAYRRCLDPAALGRLRWRPRRWSA